MNFHIIQLEGKDTFVFAPVTKDTYMDFPHIIIKCKCSQFCGIVVTVITGFSFHIASLFYTEQPGKKIMDLFIHCISFLPPFKGSVGSPDFQPGFWKLSFTVCLDFLIESFSLLLAALLGIHRFIMAVTGIVHPYPFFLSKISSWFLM
jgi:hypothetical protein